MLNPTYLHRNSYGIWYFRIAVPKHLRYTLQLREIKRSLRTLSRAEAMMKARKLAVIALDLFALPGVTSEMINKELKIKTTVGGVTEEVEIDSNNLEAELEALKAYREMSGTKTVGASVEELREAADQRRQKMGGEVSCAPKRMRFSEVVKSYDDHMKKQEKWTEKTRDENISIYEAFIDCMTDIYMDELTIDVAEDFLTTLRALPPNRNKLKVYRNKTVPQIVAMKLPKNQTMSKSTVNKYLRRVSQLCNYAVYAEATRFNPFTRLSVKDKSKGKKRVSFTDAEAAAIVSPENLKLTNREVHKFWLPIIAALTGARLEEIAQLHVSDIKTIDGIECFCFTDIPEDGEEDDKSLKTGSSVRTIPIHSELLRLNFIPFWAHQKLCGYEKLFPALKSDRYGKFSSSYSKHFTRHRRNCGIDGNGKAFHSYRHTVATKLKRAEQDFRKSAAVIGHYSGDDFTFAYYGEAYLPKQLIEIVESIQYDGVFDSVKPWTSEA